MGGPDMESRVKSINPDGMICLLAPSSDRFDVWATLGSLPLSSAATLPQCPALRATPGSIAIDHNRVTGSKCGFASAVSLGDDKVTGSKYSNGSLGRH